MGGKSRLGSGVCADGSSPFTVEVFPPSRAQQAQEFPYSCNRAIFLLMRADSSLSAQVKRLASYMTMPTALAEHGGNDFAWAGA